MQDLIGPISQVGFPIVVALLLLVRVEAKMEKVGDKIERFGEKIDQNTQATQKLTTIIDERMKKRK